MPPWLRPHRRRTLFAARADVEFIVGAVTGLVGGEHRMLELGVIPSGRLAVLPHRVVADRGLILELLHAGTDGWRRLRVLLRRRKVRARWNAVICSKPGKEPELRSQNSARRRRASDFLGTHLGTSVSQFSPPFFRPSPSPSEKLAAPAVDSCLKQTK